VSTILDVIMQRQIVTLEDVAARAGVSMKTVSRVVNNSPHVAPATRDRVQQSIDELNYQPNRLASSLASGHTNTVGVLVHHTSQQIFAYPFFSELLSGISKGLNEGKYDILLRFMDESMSYTELYEQRRVDGLIVTNPPIGKLREMQGLLQVPCVFTSHIALTDNPSNIVDSDFAGGTERALVHLFDLGHTRIVLLAGPADLALSHTRHEVYRRTFAERGLPIDEALVQSNPLFCDTDILRDHLFRSWLRLDPPPTAFLCSDDITAINLLSLLHEAGYQVPQDFSVVTYDDTLLARLATPHLTAVRQQAYRKGHVAAQTLLTVMAEQSEEPIQVNLDMTLHVRDSTGPAPAINPN
jgi:DNA-binding LacI/PurR family transcriptional regulator